MSFTKKIYENNFSNNVQEITKKTLNNNDITPVLGLLDNSIDVVEYLSINNPDNVGLWNEIVSDIIASINSATSGFYRQAIITLRSILELGCMAFYFNDHKIEYHLFKTHDGKADKYVSTLIRDHDFFTTKYIHSFYPNIENVQKERNSVSNYLNRLYKDLSDAVHGRYKTLTKTNDLKIYYDVKQFNFYQDKLQSVIGILVTMFILRYNITDKNELYKLVNRIGVVNL
ncbi:hypothetical protein RY820_04855 [Bacillus subtilis]|uniref:hypothetical protein n=1 Tax=Bacillus subtilis TaxID=1423 RepID=UPI002955C93E|nr:hypothetical protein [Bacillus subtilis]MEC1921736.1 hypothetical protein [Bacillus subtilis]WOO46563.1 hypothetical protein RY820_04855 [Bacillus subtilis]